MSDAIFSWVNQNRDEVESDLKYFWQETRDLKRLCYYEEKYEDIKKEFPELVNAFEQYELAEKTMSVLCECDW